jgi:predicted O-linked N-acetylglucosamine transferase (SPINDLY family)
MAERFASLADQFHLIAGQNARQVAELIRRHEIDIVVDLAGHTAHNRLQVFALRPAPVQVTYLGYPNTTGMSQVDFRLTDGVADPPGEADALHAETLFRLEHTAWCYQPVPEAGEIAPLPALANGYITFGSFNALGKVNPWLIALWSRVLKAVPNARLIVKAPGLRSESTRQRTRDAFAAIDIDPSRVEPIGSFVDPREHFAAYGSVDIGLDTFPYHGTTTTCEAMWMGVPVVTLAGNVHVSRVGVSLLTAVGLTDLIAADADQYVEIAKRTAANIDQLSRLRSTLRDRMRISSLMDAPGFTRRMEDAYRRMWNLRVGA